MIFLISVIKCLNEMKLEKTTYILSQNPLISVVKISFWVGSKVGAILMAAKNIIIIIIRIELLTINRHSN